MKIILEKSILRPLNKKDIAPIALHANNFKIFSMLKDHFPYPFQERDAELFIEMNEPVYPPQSLAIEVDGKAAGVIGVTLKGDVYRINAELGYWLGEPFWGRGIMSEAVQAMSHYAFEKFNIIRLYANVFEGNIASMRVLEKAGFEKETVLRKWVIKNGKVLDEHMFAFVRRERQAEIYLKRL